LYLRWDSKCLSCYSKFFQNYHLYSLCNPLIVLLTHFFPKNSPRFNYLNFYLHIFLLVIALSHQYFSVSLPPQSYVIYIYLSALPLWLYNPIDDPVSSGRARGLFPFASVVVLNLNFLF